MYRTLWRWSVAAAQERACYPRRCHCGRCLLLLHDHWLDDVELARRWSQYRLHACSLGWQSIQAFSLVTLGTRRWTRHYIVWHFCEIYPIAARSWSPSQRKMRTEQTACYLLNWIAVEAWKFWFCIRAHQGRPCTRQYHWWYGYLLAVCWTQHGITCISRRNPVHLSRNEDWGLGWAEQVVINSWYCKWTNIIHIDV